MPQLRTAQGNILKLETSMISILRTLHTILKKCVLFKHSFRNNNKNLFPFLSYVSCRGNSFPRDRPAGRFQSLHQQRGPLPQPHQPHHPHRPQGQLTTICDHLLRNIKIFACVTYASRWSSRAYWLINTQLSTELICRSQPSPLVFISPLMSLDDILQCSSQNLRHL